MSSYVKTIWFLLLALSVLLGIVGASHVIHSEDWRQLVIALAGGCGSLATMLAAKWQAHEKTVPSPQPLPPAAVLLPLAFLLFSGCAYCKDATHKDEARCKAEVIAANCGEAAVSRLVGQIFPQVIVALVSADFSALLADLELTLRHQGITDALAAITCAVQQADGSITLPVGLSPDPNLLAVKQHAQIWLAPYRQARK